MSSKTEALVRDLAALFVKYRLGDWTPILSELERRGGSDALSEAIRRHVAEVALSTAAKRKPTKIRSGKPETKKLKQGAQLDLEPRFTGPNAAIVERLRQALVAKTSLPSVQSIKAAHAALGLKSIGSSRREAMVAILTNHLDHLDDAGFEKAMAILARAEERSREDGVADYDRWFQLITDRRGDQ